MKIAHSGSNSNVNFDAEDGLEWFKYSSDKSFESEMHAYDGVNWRAPLHRQRNVSATGTRMQPKKCDKTLLSWQSVVLRTGVLLYTGFSVSPILVPL